MRFTKLGVIVVVTLTGLALSGCAQAFSATPPRVVQIASQGDGLSMQASAQGSLAWSTETGCLILQTESSELILVLDHQSDFGDSEIVLADGTTVPIPSQSLTFGGGYVPGDTEIVTGQNCLQSGSELFFIQSS